MHSGDELRGLFIAAIAADDCAINFQELRGIAQNASDALIVHAWIIKRRDEIETVSRNRGSTKKAGGGAPAAGQNFEREAMINLVSSRRTPGDLWALARSQTRPDLLPATCGSRRR